MMATQPIPAWLPAGLMVEPEVILELVLWGILEMLFMFTNKYMMLLAIQLKGFLQT